MRALAGLFLLPRLFLALCYALAKQLARPRGWHGGTMLSQPRSAAAAPAAARATRPRTAMMKGPWPATYGDSS